MVYHDNSQLLRLHQMTNFFFANVRIISLYLLQFRLDHNQCILENKSCELLLLLLVFCSMYRITLKYTFFLVVEIISTE